MSEVVVITGASAGVGRAVARMYGERGASVALLARNREALENAKREVEQRGGRAIVVECDVSDAAAVESAAARAESELGPIDIWINNAMVSVLSPVREMTADEYRRVTEVTYLGVVHGTLAALRRMLPRDRGAIVQVGSSLAYRGIPLQSAYCAAKHAIQGFHDSLRSDHPRRRELNVGGGTTEVILANSFVPGVLDHYLGRVGFDGQLGDEPEDPGRPDNLFTTLPGDRGAHGPFDDQATSRSPHLWSNTHRGAIGAALAAAAVFTLASLLRRR
jgi:NAD(P)-dependent dehydrogenase (short-subunit alcohol dehydrogenase family)